MYYFSLVYPVGVFCYNCPLSPQGQFKLHPLFTHFKVDSWLNDQAKINISLELFSHRAASVYFNHSTFIFFYFELVDKV